jgi:hypothetical protein
MEHLKRYLKHHSCDLNGDHHRARRNGLNRYFRQLDGEAQSLDGIRDNADW